MRKIKFVYNDKKDLESLCELVEGRDFEVDVYNESVAKDKRCAYRIKNTYGARMLPFLVIENEETKPKVFYTEGGDVLRNFENYLKGYKQKDFSFIEEFVQRCKKYELKPEYVVKKINEFYTQSGVIS